MGFPGLVIRVPAGAADIETKVTHDGRHPVGTHCPARFQPDPHPVRSHGHLARSGVESTHVMNQLGLPDGVSATASPLRILDSGTTVAPVESPTLQERTSRVVSIVLAGWLVGTAFLALRLLVDHRRMARLAGRLSCGARGRGALPRTGPADATGAPRGPPFALPV